MRNALVFTLSILLIGLVGQTLADVDQVAILQLRQQPYGLVDLIAEGRLIVADSPAKAGAAGVPSGR